MVVRGGRRAALDLPRPQRKILVKTSLRHLTRSVALVALTAVAATGCSAAPGTEPVPSSETSQVVVTTIDAGRLAALPAGQKLVIDLSRPDVEYVFDYATASIDFSRITIHFADGHDVSMADWLKQTATNEGDFVAQNAGQLILRPTASVGSGEKPQILIPIYDSPIADGDDPQPCVTLCIWVCSAPEGPCTYSCITSCP
jgi:hypothetical protein